MRRFFTTLRAPAAIGFFLTLPFMILELVFDVNRGGMLAGGTAFRRTAALDFAALFGALWLLPTAALLLLVPVARQVRAGREPGGFPLRLSFSLAAAALIAALWGSLLIDQLPCMLGVPNCD